MMTNTTSTASKELHLPLEPFLAMLRKRGFVIKPDDYLEVLRLVRQFGTNDIDQTAEWLCPVLATNPFEQSLFYSVLEDYKNKQAPVVIADKEGKRSWLRRYWWVHIAILGITIILFTIRNAPPPLRAKMPVLQTHYQVGDTIYLEASEVFFNRQKDTAETFVFWRRNNELPVKGYRAQFVANEEGKLRIIQSLRSGNIDSTKRTDTAFTYVCGHIPEFDLVAGKEEIRVNEKVLITANPRDTSFKNVIYKWEQTGVRDTTLSGDKEILVSFDTAGVFRISCTAIPSDGYQGCSATKEISIKVTQQQEDYTLDLRMAGSKWEAPKPKMKKILHWLLLVPSIAGILLLDFLKRRRDKRKDDTAKKEGRSYEEMLPELKPVFEVPFEKRDTKLIADESILKRVFNQMRQKTEGDSLQLNIPETITSISKSGGIPELIFSPRMHAKEFLVLIDRSNPKSMMTAFFDWFARAISDANIPVTIVYSDHDFRCYHNNFPLGISLYRLGQLYSHHTLLIAGNGYNLLDRAYPVINPIFIDALDQWEQKAIITPVPYPDWGVKEKAIGGRMILLPADLNTLEYLMPALREKSLQTTRYLKPKKALWTSLLDWDFEDTEELKAYLGHDEVLFQWLCAICLYPKIRWEIIIEAGNKICTRYNSPDQLNYSNLLTICRISWIAEGTFPQRTRLQLLKELNPENEVLVRQTIIGMLNTAKSLFGEGYYFNFEQEAQQITNEFVLYANDAEKFAGYQESSHKFLNNWEKDWITDAPIRRYLGPQENDKWHTPLNQQNALENAGLKLETLKRKENIKKKGWMEYAESILGWGIILYLLLLFKALPADSKVFGIFYNKNPDKEVSFTVALQFEDSCLPRQKPYVAYVAGDVEYPMQYADSTSDGPPVFPLYGSITSQYNALRQPGSKLMITWDNGEEREFEIIQLSDSILLTSVCLQKMDSIEVPGIDTPSIVIDSPKTAITPKFTSSDLRPYFNEIWTSSLGKIAIDLNRDFIYTQYNGGNGLQRNQITGSYRNAETGEYYIIVTDQEGNFQRLKIKPRNSEAFQLAGCDSKFKEASIALEDAAPCENYNTYSLYYSADREKVFIPFNGLNYANTEVLKIKKIIAGLEEKTKNIRAPQMQQQQVQAPKGSYRLSANVYLNTYYYGSTRQQQARQKQIKSGWKFTGRDMPVTWQFTPFNGGPFDRDYINIFEQYVMDEPIIETPEEKPVQGPLSPNQLNRIIEYARKEVGVTETPPGSNKGPRINEYLSSIGLKPGLPWSTAFIYWVYKQAGAEGKLRKTGSVKRLWDALDPAEKITQKEAMANPSLIQPGNLFFIDFGNNVSQIGIVEKVMGESIFIIEGNSNNNGTDESHSVIKGVRQLNKITIGFSSFGRKAMPARPK